MRGIDGIDDRGVPAADLAIETGAEQGIDDDIGPRQAPGEAVRGVARRDAGGRGQRHGQRRVAPDARRLADQREVDLEAFGAREGGNDEAVAAVVAGTTDDGETPRLRPFPAQGREGRATGALHQLEPGDTRHLDGMAVERARGRRVVERGWQVGERAHAGRRRKWAR